MEKKNEKATKLLGEINKALGEDDSSELLHILRQQGRISEKQWQELVVVQRQALEKQQLIKEGIIKLIEAARGLKLKLPDIFDVKVSNQKDFPGSIKISNLEDIKFPGDGFKKPLWLSDLLAKWVSLPIIKALGKKLQDVNLTGPTDPAKAIAVRLSDGQKFYTAILNAVTQGSSNSKLVEDLLQQIADNTADIEINADTINLNTDTLETLLGQFKFDGDKLKVDASVTIPAGLATEFTLAEAEEDLDAIMVQLQSIIDGHEPLLREPLKTFTNEFLSSSGGVITSQAIITPPAGKKISVKIINTSTESSGGVYNLDFLTSAIKVWRYYPGANSSIWQGAVIHIEGAVDEVLKFSATGVGNTRKMFLQVGYEFK